jgi:hypothetical protein
MAKKSFRVVLLLTAVTATAAWATDKSLSTQWAQAEDENVTQEETQTQDSPMDTAEPQDVPAADVPDYAEPGTGGSEDPSMLPEGQMQQMDPAQTPEDPNVPPRSAVEVPAEVDVTQVTVEETDDREEKRKFTDNLRITVGGGVEGYTGILNNRVNAGPTWAATIGTHPMRGFGAEIAYSGAVNEVNGGIATGPNHAVNGADIVRNGGHVAITLSAPTPYVQPYAVGGIGVDRYQVRGGQQFGFDSDTAGRVPLGAGVQTRVGPFTADARIQYNALFDQEFAEFTTNEGQGGGYTGMLQVGGRF